MRYFVLASALCFLSTENFAYGETCNKLLKVVTRPDGFANIVLTDGNVIGPVNNTTEDQIFYALAMTNDLTVCFTKLENSNHFEVSSFYK